MRSRLITVFAIFAFAALIVASTLPSVAQQATGSGGAAGMPAASGQQWQSQQWQGQQWQNQQWQGQQWITQWPLPPSTQPNGGAPAAPAAPSAAAMQQNSAPAAPQQPQQPQPQGNSGSSGYGPPKF